MAKRAVTVKVEGSRVLVFRGGNLVLDLPWDAAKEISSVLRAQAAVAEEWAKPEQVALDAALALRFGLPIGLTDNPKIRAEAAKEAWLNKDLRRYCPGGVKGQIMLGTPTVIKHPPKRIKP